MPSWIRSKVAVSLFCIGLIALGLLPAAASAGKAGISKGHPVSGPKPAAPVITGTDPASPSKDSTPRVFGDVKGGSGGSVQIFVDDRDCSGRPDAPGSAVQFTHGGIRVKVPVDRTVRLTATVKVHGRSSRCSAPISYTHDPRTYTPGAQTVGDPLFPQIGNGG